MKLDVYNLQNERVGEIEVEDTVFDAEVKPHLHHEVVRAQLAKRRRGTACTKTRAQVAGSMAKMYRQKGTGRARHSTTKVPTMVGGGVAFGPKPRSFELKVNKKVRRNALRSVLSEKVANGHLKVVDDFSMAAPKTANAAIILRGLDTTKALVVDRASNQNLKLSVRNLKDFKFLAADGLNVRDALRYEHLVVTRSAIESIQGALS